MFGKKKLLFTCLAVALIGGSAELSAQTKQAKWISANLDKQDSVNVWTAYRKSFEVKTPPKKALARIAVDSKYWLYVNGKLIVFEGGLKRGPNPQDTYYDEVDLGPYLQKGENHIAIQVWYFGKHGFSHNSSGKAGLFFDLKAENLTLSSDKSWKVKRQKEYRTAADPIPNFRLPESNILYDARLGESDWYLPNFKASDYQEAQELGVEGIAPWNKLHKRSIPLFKDFGLKSIRNEDITRRGDTLICKLPYNMQFTPYVEIDAPAGQLVKFLTDNYLIYNGSAENIRAEYISKDGVQSYENPGWINGHYLYLIAPREVNFKAIKYRETGYNTEFTGSFHSDDPFFNKLWEKARRTLYITMRDSYMDCPDRERAQWTGDAVLEAEEAFYALDVKSHGLAKKWLYEVVNWQKQDGAIFSPAPAGNWDKELPDQVLATIGYYGIWTYYMHTGDKKILSDLYPKIQTYLKLWEKYPDGLVKLRAGGWQWGDWGHNKDMLLLYNLWYYLAIKGNYLMALELGKTADAKQFKQEMEVMSKAFNARFWKDGEYRDPDYKEKTDDRVHALAVLAGIAKEDQYAAIQKVLSEQEHASPYMEKYVFEAMFNMQLPSEALLRHKKRFSPMVNNDYFTTLFEGWGIGADGFGGGTVNHAWSGGGLTILSSQVCGIQPLSPGYKTFAIHPQLGSLKEASAQVSSVIGEIQIHLKEDSNSQLIKVVVPAGSKAKLYLPKKQLAAVNINEKALIQNEKLNNSIGKSYQYQINDQSLWLSPGTWSIQSTY
ncbi:alpha-L-rhamnosidase C-terminal domain-containing protein [Sphingobacterium sp. HJSM2_6]|uniref:alpha-L-rhamnosidase-related protein n=1 Tax=Sphingobacterium sp. HJSM2_6 TaxID=3366264 RepID=UPI003BCAD3A5